MHRAVLASLLLAAGLVVATVALPDCVDCPEYVALSAHDKADVIWDKLIHSEYSMFPNDWYTLSMAELFTEDMNEPFDRYSDQLPSGRKKLIHTFGTIAQVKFLPDENEYSGIFQGSNYGFARLSVAKDPSGGFTPGMAIKFMRDGTYSANIISMYELSGQGSDYNFFKNEMKTWVSMGEGLALELGAKIFRKGSSTPTHLSVDNLGIAGEDGKEVGHSEFNYPGQLYFEPSPSLQTRFASSEHEWRGDLKQLPTGTTLYTVWAANDCTCGGSEKPCEKVSDCKDKKKIGSLVTTSRFVASSWGDSQMFFQHYRFGKKGRRTCVYKNNLNADTNARLSGNLNEQCVTGSCPSIGGWFHSVKAVKQTDGCPFHLNSKQESWVSEPMVEDANINSTPASVVPAVVGCVAAVAIIGVVIALVRSRSREVYREMDAATL